MDILTCNKQGRQSVIVDRIGYDKEGHTVYTKLGNGTETTYTYDKQRERLLVINSLYYGIRILATKGFKGGVKYDKKTGETSYEFKGWGNATNNFNGGGVRNYQNDVETMVRESKPRKR